MLSDRIKAMMREFNPWWEGKPVEVPDYKRHIFLKIQKYMRTKQIVAIVGLRRVGKTVLMKQIIKEIIPETEKENAFYFMFDEISAQNTETLEELLDYFLKTVAKPGRKYIFLDEIQKVPYWQDALKRLYDTRNDIKFVVSGSASLKIKKSKESLAGRLFDFYLPILSFSEFMELNGMKPEKAELNFNSLQKIYDSNIHKKHIVESMFLSYIFKGAFPELAREEDEEIIKNYVKNSVVEKIVMEDIPAVFEVRRKDVLYSMLEYCSKETSGLLDITNLSKTLGINYQTARSYIFYLQNAFVVDILYNYSRSIAKQLRKNKKIHVAHPSITITIMRYTKSILNNEEQIGKYAESVIFQHSKLLSERVFFWRSPQKEEVDIVMENGRPLPVEVKYSSRVGLSDCKNLLKFMKKHKLKKGIMVTKDLLEENEADGRKILFVPAWLFLLAG